MNAAWLLKQYAFDVVSLVLDVFPDPELRRNAVFRDRHRGERCFLLGSGHSIKEQDLTKLAGEIVMTQNHFHAHEQIGIISPTYHVNVPKYQPRSYDDDWVEWLRSMDERLPKKTVIFFGKNTKYLVDELRLFQDRAYYVQPGYSAALLGRAPTDLTRRIMRVPTVLPQCLAIAIYMGFKEIYLLGFDLDQQFRQNNRDQLRFYGLSPITRNAAEIALEQKGGASGDDWLGFWLIWRQCNLLKQAAERKGLKIINATRGGLLNMFDRQVYEEVVK